MTQYRQADRCFMLTDGFNTFSTDIDDWFLVCVKSLFFLLLTFIVNYDDKYCKQFSMTSFFMEIYKYHYTKCDL